MNRIALAPGTLLARRTGYSDTSLPYTRFLFRKNGLTKIN
ncbi:hypothetical protein SRB521_02812 [Intestinimonas butyriciproducens]|nr:hypothetical protein SRB521_02812 [Intestinimonas butyriciproducens]